MELRTEVLQQIAQLFIGFGIRLLIKPHAQGDAPLGQYLRSRESRDLFPPCPRYAWGLLGSVIAESAKFEAEQPTESID
jgi:hypothetical protein